MHDSSWEKLLHDLLKRLSCVKRKKNMRDIQKKPNLYSEEQLNQQHLFYQFIYWIDFFIFCHGVYASVAGGISLPNYK